MPRIDRDARRSAGAAAGRGVLAILFGIVAWIWPDLTVTALVVLFGAYALVDGVFDIVAAFTTGGGGRWLPLLLAGLAAIVFGVIVAIFPGSGAIALVWLIGIYAIFFGNLLIALAFRLRGLRSDAPPTMRA